MGPSCRGLPVRKCNAVSLVSVRVAADAPSVSTRRLVGAEVQVATAPQKRHTASCLGYRARPRHPPPPPARSPQTGWADSFLRCPHRGEELTAGALAVWGSGCSSPTHSSLPVSPLTNDEGAVSGLLDHSGPVERKVAQPGATKNEVLVYRPEGP